MYIDKKFFGTELEVLNFWNWNGTVETFNFGSELELERNCQSKAVIWNGTGTLDF